MAVPYTNIIANALANKPISTPDQPAFGTFTWLMQQQNYGAISYIPVITYTLNYFNPHVLIYSTTTVPASATGITLQSSIPAVIEAKGLDFVDTTFLSAFSQTVTVGGNNYTFYYNSMRCNEPFYLSSTAINQPVYISPLTAFSYPPPNPYSTVYYIANRSDGLYGSGTKSDPYNGTVYFDDVLGHLCGQVTGGQGPAAANNICIYLSSGTYNTVGNAGGVAAGGAGPNPSWRMGTNWTLSGAGTSTVVNLVSTFRNTFYTGPSGQLSLGVGYFTNINDSISGCTISNMIIDGYSSGAGKRNISTLTYSSTAAAPLQITTTTAHTLTAGDVFAIGGVVWQNASGTQSRESDGHLWMVDRPTTTFGLSARPYNNFIIQAGLSAAYLYTPASIAICNSVPIVLRNSGNNIIQNITAYGTGPIYENLGLIQITSIGRWSNSNLVDSNVVITVPFSGENIERAGTGIGIESNNSGWSYTTPSAVNSAWVSAIVSNNLVLSSSQGYGNYGMLNTLFTNNTSRHCSVGWFTDTGVNVGTVISNNSFLDNLNWGMIINAPIFRNGYIFNNYFTSKTAGTEGLLATLGTPYTRSFANTLFYNNILSGFTTQYNIDAATNNPGSFPLSACITLFNNITA
jgi:hypothetical protein